MLQGSESQPISVERYELLAELAAGGMATVYLARLGGAGGFQRLYAVKRLHPHLAREPEFIQMFLDEARLAARIYHPNVVPILEVLTSGSGYYLIMEYVEGETLARLIGRLASRNQRLPLRVVIKIVLDTLAGLDAAHCLTDDFGAPLHIVHRDVSPQNIIVGVDGTSRITDFGVARAASRLTSTRAGQLKGKLGYMAPEQAQGEDVDRRADVFAMGVILWEALTGRRLFRPAAEGNDAALLNRLLYAPVPTLRQAWPEADERLELITARALERDPQRRFSSCSEMADALEQYAVAAGGIASPREVAALVDTVAGPELTAQRDIIRAWASRSQVSRIERLEQPQDLSSQMVAIPLTPRQAPAASSRKRLWIGLAAGCAVVAIASAGATWALLRPRPAPVQAPASASAVLTDVPLAASAAESAATAAASTASASATASESPPSSAVPASAGTPKGPWPPSNKTAAPENGTPPTPDDLTRNPYR